MKKGEIIAISAGAAVLIGAAVISVKNHRERKREFERLGYEMGASDMMILCKSKKVFPNLKDDLRFQWPEEVRKGLKVRYKKHLKRD